MGDFNLHLDSPSSDVRQLTAILGYFDLDQYVDFLTHIHGHAFDLMMFSKRCYVLFVSTYGMISYYFSVFADFKIPTNHGFTVPQTITYWTLKVIAAVKVDVKIFRLNMCPKTNATELTQQYDSVLSLPVIFILYDNLRKPKQDN